MVEIKSGYEMPVAELLDRFTISQLKKERIGCEEEYNSLKSFVMNLDFYFNSEIELLYNINRKIWDLESDIRKGLDEKLGLEEIGRRAITIREHNNIRVKIKNYITEMSKTGFKDIKKDHISE